MTARSYELDAAVEALTGRLRRLELAVSRDKPAGGITVSDPSGDPIPPLTDTDLLTAITEILALIAALNIDALDEGVSLTAALDSLDFVGAGVTATAAGGAVTVTIPGGTASGEMVPYLIPTGETFTVPLYKQALKAMAITINGTLVVDGYLIEVN